MKHLVIIAALLFGCLSVRSQDTVSRSNQLNPQIYESFYVLKSNKKVRHGLYIAVYKKSTVLAKGEYNNGKRAGQWQFFDGTGKPAQVYNYDEGRFTMIDEAGKKGTKCTFAQEPAPTDSVSKPIAIGGFIYAVTPLIAIRPDIDDKVRPYNMEEGKMQTVYHLLDINEEGFVTKHTAYTEIDGKKRTCDVDDRDYTDGSQKFVPATINHKPVACQVTYQTGFSIRIRTSTTTTTRSSIGAPGRPDGNGF
ncbi:hypothetical protein ACFGVR_01095 [Mucilaginibacter sp. AW1-3]